MCTCGCGSDCPNCGCEYGCWGVCDDGVCDLSACCEKPPATCGCCLTWDSNTACCLNDTYYITFQVSGLAEQYFYVNSDGEQVPYTQGYIEFQFENCVSIYPQSAISTDDCIFNFMVYWNQYQLQLVGYNSGNQFISSCSTLTTSKPGSTFLNVTTTFNGVDGCCSNINYAEHSYFWPEECILTPWTLNDSNPPSGYAFTSYALVNCDSTFPLYDLGTCMNPV
jgi:hypothetical protein